MLSGIAWPTNLTRHSEPLDKLRRRISCKAYMRFIGWRLWMTGWLSLRTKWSNPEKYYTKMIGISANRIRNIFLFLTTNLFCRNSIRLHLALNGNAPNQIEKRGFRLWFVVFRFAHASARLAKKSHLFLDSGNLLEELCLKD